MTSSPIPPDVMQTAEKLVADFMRDASGPSLAERIALAIVREREARFGAAGLTQKQREALDFIAAYSDKNGLAPSFEDIRLTLGLASRSGVHRLICGLEKRGYIRRIHGSSKSAARSLAIVEGAPV